MATERQKNKEIYWAWKAMKQRCLNPKCHAYKNYGGRGITVCEEWMTFEPFLDWCKRNGWKKGLALDRRNNEKGYAPDNCRFVTPQVNNNNTRKTAYLTVGGITKSESDWARALGIGRGTVKAWRITNGEEYAEARLSEALKGEYRAKNYAYGNPAKVVLLVEENKIFNSIASEAEYIGLAPCTITNSLRMRDGKTSKGHFRVMMERVCK